MRQLELFELEEIIENHNFTDLKDCLEYFHEIYPKQYKASVVKELYKKINNIK